MNINAGSINKHVGVNKVDKTVRLELTLRTENMHIHSTSIFW